MPEPSTSSRWTLTCRISRTACASRSSRRTGARASARTAGAARGGAEGERALGGGDVFEKAGVNFSASSASFSAGGCAGQTLAGRSFIATGISLVLHPRNPIVPTVHANLRFLRQARRSGVVVRRRRRSDAVLTLRRGRGPSSLRRVRCLRLGPDVYPRFKKWCDDYFYLPHRKETRGVGGIFFDYLDEWGIERSFAFVRTSATPSCRLPADRRAAQRHAYGERERALQLFRRGRYVEFNLLYDRGTLFGLKTGGRIESILMSLPPLVRWDTTAARARLARGRTLLEHLQPQDWLDGTGYNSGAELSPLANRKNPSTRAERAAHRTARGGLPRPRRHPPASHRGRGRAARAPARRRARVLDLGLGVTAVCSISRCATAPRRAASALDFSPAMLDGLRARFAGSDRVEIVAHDFEAPLPGARRLRRGGVELRHPSRRASAQAVALRRGVGWPRPWRRVPQPRARGVADGAPARLLPVGDRLHGRDRRPL